MLGLYRCLLLATLIGLVSGFLPLQPSNDTSDLTDPDDSDSTILLRWTDQGNYHEGISRRQVNAGGSVGIEKVLIFRGIRPSNSMFTFRISYRVPLSTFMRI